MINIGDILILLITIPVVAGYFFGTKGAAIAYVCAAIILAGKWQRKRMSK